MHFGQNATDEYLKGLTCEKLITKVNSRGFEESEWINPPGARNEPLDLEVYILAMLELVKRRYALGTMWTQLERSMGVQVAGATTTPPALARRKTSSFWDK